MVGEPVGAEVRRSRWLPAVVFSLLALVFLADAVVIALYGNYRNLIEEQGVEAVFTPADLAGDVAGPETVEVPDGSRAVAADGRVLVEASGGTFEVLAPGTLTIRFRAPDAGSYVELGYRFSEARSDARSELSLARVASRHGVDYMCRRSLTAKKKTEGMFRHYLADHAGWFELSLQVDPSAVAVGFEVDKPEIVWE